MPLKDNKLILTFLFTIAERQKKSDFFFEYYFRGCAPCPQNPHGHNAQNPLRDELLSQDSAPINIFSESPTEFSDGTNFQPDEARSSETDKDTQPSEDVATPFVEVEASNFWDAEHMANDISSLRCCEKFQPFESECKAQDRSRATKERTKGSFRVVQRTEAQLASPGYIKVPPPSSPKPPTAIKRIFATSYSKSYVAESMRNLHWWIKIILEKP